MASTSFWLVTLSLVTSLAKAQLSVPENWTAPERQAHGLVGRIWSRSARAFIDVGSLSVELSHSKYLLLGEKHDNPDHHLLQRAVISELIGRNRVEQVTFEMLDSRVHERLIELYQQAPMDSEQLQAYLLWDTDGWDWNFYGPLVETVYSAGLRISAGNLSRDQVTSIYARGGTETPVLDDNALAVLRRDIDESHCGMLPESQFPAMMRVQQARDLAMATAMSTPQEDRTSILIAGNYHVRRDVGVPRYLFLAAPDLQPEAVVSLAFLEVQPGQMDPAAYQESTDGRHAFDYIWFTPSVREQDYCATLGQ